MVGFYPDVPDNRIAYDLNGSVCNKVNGLNNTSTLATDAEIRALNDDSSSYINFGYFGPPSHFAIILPQPYNLSGLFGTFTGQSGSHPIEWTYSTDSTNGIDGNWLGTGYTGLYSDVMIPFYRTNISQVSLSNVKVIRASMDGGYDRADRVFYAVHLYGTPVTLSNQLALWHPSNDARVSGPYFDFGDVTRGYTYVKQFRIKNTATQTANDTVVSLDVPTDANPTLVGQIQFSIDGVTYSNTINIPTLASSEMSPVLYARYIPTIISQLSLWSGRIKAVATTWT